MTRIDKHRVTRDDREKAREVMEEMDEQVRKRSVSIENRNVREVCSSFSGEARKTGGSRKRQIDVDEPVLGRGRRVTSRTTSKRGEQFTRFATVPSPAVPRLVFISRLA